MAAKKTKKTRIDKPEPALNAAEETEDMIENLNRNLKQDICTRIGYLESEVAKGFFAVDEALKEISMKLEQADIKKIKKKRVSENASSKSGGVMSRLIGSLADD